jgi:hypothetical protein
MAARRTAWHCLFTVHLRRFAAPDFEVRDEVPLSAEPPRMDYLLLRRTRAVPADASDAAGSTLRALWPRLGMATVVELKTTTRPYRADDLDRLWGYVHLFRTDRDNRPPLRGDLRAVLIVPARTPALLGDVDEMGLGWEDLGGGYWQLHRGLFTMYVVEIDRVCEQEDDDFLRVFSHQPQRTLEGRQFWAELVGSLEVGMSLHEMEDYDDVIRRLLSTLTPEQRMAGIPPEQRIEGLSPEQLLARVPPEQRFAGLPPEQRLADLDVEQAILALPDAALRGLSDEYVATLSEPTRDAIRRRIGR